MIDMTIAAVGLGAMLVGLLLGWSAARFCQRFRDGLAAAGALLARPPAQPPPPPCDYLEVRAGWAWHCTGEADHRGKHLLQAVWESRTVGPS
jgi:hypothetical protein